MSDLLGELVVHLECPQLEASGQFCDGGESEKKLLGAAQRDIRVEQLSLLDPLLLLFRGDHCEDFLGETAGWESLIKSLSQKLHFVKRGTE